MRVVVALLVGLAVLPGRLWGQDLEARIKAIEKGTVHLSYDTRQGVCGVYFGERNNWEWEDACAPKPVLISLQVENGRVTDLRGYFGGRWRRGVAGVVDFGKLRPPVAVNFLIGLVKGRLYDNDNALLAASLAEGSVAWPALLRVARDSSLSANMREGARRLLAHAVSEIAIKATDSVGAAVTQMAEQERDLRRDAVRALADRSADEAIPQLIDIARTHQDPDIRRAAFLGLAKHDDPRTFAFFEEWLGQTAALK